MKRIRKKINKELKAKAAFETLKGLKTNVEISSEYGENWFACPLRDY